MCILLLQRCHSQNETLLRKFIVLAFDYGTLSRKKTLEWIFGIIIPYLL